MAQTYKHPLLSAGADPHDVWSSFFGRCVEGYVRKALSDALYNARTLVHKQKSLSDLMRSITFDEEKEVKMMLSKSPHQINHVVSMFIQTWINRLFNMNILRMPLPQVTVPNTKSIWRLLRNKIDEHLTHCLGHLTDLNIALSESEISAIVFRFLDSVRDSCKWWETQKQTPESPDSDVLEDKNLEESDETHHQDEAEELDLEDIESDEEKDPEETDQDDKKISDGSDPSDESEELKDLDESDV